MTKWCEMSWNFLSPLIIPWLEHFVPPDEVCQRLGVCKPIDGSYCKLYSKWPKSQEEFLIQNKASIPSSKRIKLIPHIVKGIFKEEGLRSFGRLFFQDKIVWPWDKVNFHLPPFFFFFSHKIGYRSSSFQ